MTTRQGRTKLNYTFSGLPPGASVILVDSLWKYEANDIWKAAPKRVGLVKEDGTINFSGLRDSIYSLLVVDFDFTYESRYNIQIGDAKYFQTVAYHLIPTAVNLASATTGIEGKTIYVDLIWYLATGGIDGYYHIYYKASSDSTWGEWDNIVAPNVFTERITPLKYNTSYDFRIRAFNEDGRGGPYSQILTVTTPAEPKIDITPPTQASWVV